MLGPQDACLAVCTGYVIALSNGGECPHMSLQGSSDSCPPELELGVKIGCCRGKWNQLFKPLTAGNL